MKIAVKEKYIKSFSKGQITVPKEFRDQLGLDGEFWLKLSLEQNRIIAEPVNTTKDNDYAQTLLDIKGNFLSDKEIADTRNEIELRLLENE